MASNAANGYSAGSGNSIGSGKNFSRLLSAAAIVITNLASRYSTAYNVSAGSGFSLGSGNSQYAAMKSSFAC